ncbi:MAG: hypothetical protein K940chlam6_00067 [Chlamydiae bacterium]|nr:hypothetical protein [Chlamydiota bacterium]
MSLKTDEKKMKNQMTSIDPKKAIDISPSGEISFKDKEFEQRICQATGQDDPMHALYLILLTGENIDGFEKKDMVNYVIDVFEKMSPSDPVEASLIQQFIILHHQGIDRLSRAKGSEHATSSGHQVNMATKLLRLSQETLVTLLKYKNKGQQQVFVTHVNDGGKAIIGNLSHRGVDGKK